MLAWLPPTDSVIGSIVMDAFRASGLDYSRVSVVTDCPHMRVSLLATGRFVTVSRLPHLDFSPSARSSKSCPLDCQWARRPNGIVTLKNRALSHEVVSPIADQTAYGGMPFVWSARLLTSEFQLSSSNAPVLALRRKGLLLSDLPRR
jgi:hypothetical protein